MNIHITDLVDELSKDERIHINNGYHLDTNNYLFTQSSLWTNYKQWKSRVLGNSFSEPSKRRYIPMQYRNIENIFPAVIGEVIFGTLEKASHIIKGLEIATDRAPKKLIFTPDLSYVNINLPVVGWMKSDSCIEVFARNNNNNKGHCIGSVQGPLIEGINSYTMHACSKPAMSIIEYTSTGKMFVAIPLKQFGITNKRSDHSGSLIHLIDD